MMGVSETGWLLGAEDMARKDARTVHQSKESTLSSVTPRDTLAAPCFIKPRLAPAGYSPELSLSGS